MTKLALLGLGNFGTALARTWLNSGHQVNGWTVERDVYEDITANQENAKYLPGVSLQGINATMCLANAVDGADYVIMALPSSVVLDVFADVLPLLQGHQVLMDLAKGLSPDQRLVSEVIEERLAEAGADNGLCVMMGPTIAPELARGVLTVAHVASKDSVLAADTAERLSTSNLRLSSASDPTGAEYWGAFKNVIAIACGIADGLEESGIGGDNLKAALFTAGFREANEVLPQLGAAPETALTAAGIGDLFVTATSPHGRNRATGERLGRGLGLADALQGQTMVSEGVRATRMFAKRFERDGIAAPFVVTLNDLLDDRIEIDAFLERVLR